MKRLLRLSIVLTVVILAIVATGSIAMGAPPEKEDGFVCPVLGGKAGENGMAKGITKPADSGLDFATVIGPEVSVPRQATNGNNGTNNPGGPYASPGDTDYTAIWPNR
ncbi:hypothetical protein ACFLYB_05975 [Chloroflexota bacterium]